MNRFGMAVWRRVAARSRWWLALAALALCLPAVRAQDLQDDPPGRVGRIADVGGELFHAPEDRASDWATVGLNFPVTNGDNFWVAQGGRAEIDVGAGQIRLAGETNIHVSRLDDLTMAFFLAQGSVIVRLRLLDPGEVARVDTPNTQVVLMRPGLYRVDVSPDRQRTVLVVREGEATLPSQGGMQQVLPGQTAVATGLDATWVDVRNGISTDGFDTWSANRDRRYDRNRSTAYVSQHMVGAAELDEYGRWESDTSYGAVWFPTVVSPGWAPFRDGRWTWVSPFGWTWVDAAPWGFVSSHYGRWAFIGGRWGWCPGGFVARPFWAPAMVGWVGGAGWGLSLSFGAPVYGWVPLAWGEPFRPWWNNCSFRCWTHFNRPYAVRADERVWRSPPPARFVHADRPNAVTAVPAAAFTGSRRVSESLVPAKPGQLTGAPVLATAPNVERPSAAHVPMVKPGSASTPRPASAYVPPGRSAFAPARSGESARGASPGTRAVPPATSAPSTSAPGRSAAPALQSPSAGSPRGAASTSREPGRASVPPTSMPGAKPAPATAPPAARGSTPTYTAPVQRDSVQSYPPGTSRGSAPAAERRHAPSAAPAPSAGNAQAPAARPAAPPSQRVQPPAAPVQRAPQAAAPGPAAQAAPPQAVQRNAPQPAQRGASQPSSRDGRSGGDGGGRASSGGGGPGAGDKPGSGR